MPSYLIGFDIGSSSVKAALVNADTKEVVRTTFYPRTEMDVISRQAGWAEQQPEVWWENVCAASKRLLSTADIDVSLVKSIGISYQMHGLVLIDKNNNVLRPAIIWSDSRGVEIGNQAFKDIGEQKCLSRLLNSPGNFTMSKLKWVYDNEPEVAARIRKFLLPGDYIAMKMTGEIATTISGLSEAILWDFKENKIADFVLDYFGLDKSIVPDIVPTFSEHGGLTSSAATQLGLKQGTKVSYRAGDQPNNALSLNVMNPGEIAATGGTSGVVYAIVDKPLYDSKSRVNGFAHVNHKSEDPRIGVLLCINGAGSQYSWIRQQIARDGTSYTDMERMVSAVPINSEGLRILPFGNGAERLLHNKDLGSHIINLQFNRHKRAHFYRAALEGIAFSFIYGLGVLREMGIQPSLIRVGADNLFQSATFSSTIAALSGCQIELSETTGAVGAAFASSVGVGDFNCIQAAMEGIKVKHIYDPPNANGDYTNAYELWKSDLEKLITSERD